MHLRNRCHANGNKHRMDQQAIATIASNGGEKSRCTCHPRQSPSGPTAAPPSTSRSLPGVRLLAFLGASHWDYRSLASSTQARPTRARWQRPSDQSGQRTLQTLTMSTLPPMAHRSRKFALGRAVVVPSRPSRASLTCYRTGSTGTEAGKWGWTCHWPGRSKGSIRRCQQRSTIPIGWTGLTPPARAAARP